MKNVFRICLILLSSLVLLLFCACGNTAETELDSFTESAESPLPPEPKALFYYALINSDFLTADDRAAIDAILASYTNHDVFVVDVKECQTATEVYERLKADQANREGTLDGIQIFGASDAVPSFLVDFKVSTITDGVEGVYAPETPFSSDFFYTNLENNAAQISTFNVLDHFAMAQDVDLTPRWQVARLPLGGGEFSAYADRYRAYLSELGGVSPVAACFAAPTFKYSQNRQDPYQIDDMAHFMNRAQTEWGILDKVHLYANLEGDFPSTAPVLGDCTTEHLAAENQAGVREFFFKGYGQQLELLKTLFTDGQISRSYLLTYDNISEVLGNNPYFLYLCSPNAAEGLDFNIVRRALNNGCLGAFAHTFTRANNGINCMASLEDMQKTGDMFFFHYSYLKGLHDGLPRSRAWLFAQQEMEQVLAECSQKPVDFSHNYQYGYYMLLTFTNLGILDPETTIPECVAPSVGLSEVNIGHEHINLTRGKPIGERITLSRSLALRTGDTFSKLTKAYGQVLDNGYFRLYLTVATPQGGVVSIDHANGAYLTGHARRNAICEDGYILVVDIPRSELAEYRELYVNFKLDRDYIYWKLGEIRPLYE